MATTANSDARQHLIWVNIIRIHLHYRVFSTVWICVAASTPARGELGLVLVIVLILVLLGKL
jgi:hypothetical protein